jgi:glutathione synthase
LHRVTLPWIARECYMTSAVRLLFVMDPVSTIKVDADTSFALMLAAEAAGHRVDHCLSGDVFMDRGRVLAAVRRARCERMPDAPVKLSASEEVALEDVDVVFVRKDPPFDTAYHWLTLLLELVRGRTLIVNDPRGLRDANEKLYACRETGLTPESLVCSQPDRIKSFVKRVGGVAVIKDIDGHGGENVFKLTVGDDNMNALVEVATAFGTRMALVQTYLPAVRSGDKRILLLDGEPLGAINRVPRPDELRSNIHVGGRVERAEITEADARIIAALRPHLRRDGLIFVGIDVIGGMLTEVNVTSPTGIQEMARLDGTEPAVRVIAFCEERAEAIRRRPD